MSPHHDMTTSEDQKDDVTDAAPEEHMGEMSPETEHRMGDMTSAEPEDDVDEMDRPDSESKSGA